MNKNQKKRTYNPSSDADKIILITERIQPNIECPNYLEIINLRHPQHGRSTKFLFNTEENLVYELLKFSPQHRSWFIGNSVCSDGSFCLSTPIDPLFLLLPYVSKAKMSSTLDQLIHDDGFPNSMKLEALVDSEQLKFIADQKDCSGLIVWKYNEEKTLQWLSLKVNRLAKLLEAKGINVDLSCAVSQTFVKSTKDKPENYLRYAHGMISDYLDSTLSEKLSSYLKIPPPESFSDKKRKLKGLDPEEVKKIRMECKEKELSETDVNAEKKEKASRKNPRQTALARAATGSQSISSFFKKKD